MALKMNKVSEEILTSAAKAASHQKFFSKVPKSEDEANYPVFTFSDKEWWFYIPDHRVIDEETGENVFRMDKPYHTSINLSVTGDRMTKIRNSADIVNEGLGLDGTSPLDELFALQNEITNILAETEAKARGIVPDRENKEYKDIRRAFLDKALVRRKTLSYTFPVAVFELEDSATGRGKVPVKDANGKPIYTLYWFKLSEFSYNETIRKGLLSTKNEFDLADEEETPWVSRFNENSFEDCGGLWFKIDGHYNDEKTEWSPRDVVNKFNATVLKSIPKTVISADDLKALEEEIFKSTESWTPAKSIEMVIENHFYPVDAVRDEIAPVRQKLEEEKKDAEDQRNLGGKPNVGAPSISSNSTSSQKSLETSGEVSLDDLDD